MEYEDNDENEQVERLFFGKYFFLNSLESLINSFLENDGVIDLTELNLMYNQEDEPEIADILTLFGFEAFIGIFKG